MNHITQLEIYAMALGVIATWVLKWSKEKDQFDLKKEEFSSWQWIKNWFRYRNDNIIAHIVVSVSALYIGVDNLQAWMGESLNFPDSVDEVGAAYMIGFFGSYLAEMLKKAL